MEQIEAKYLSELAPFGVLSELQNIAMKKLKLITSVMLGLSVLGAPMVGWAADAKDQPKADKLDTCPVSGDKLGEMGKPFAFVYQGQEVKLCCKNCKKDFDKDPAKYIKKIRAADANTKK